MTDSTKSNFTTIYDKHTWLGQSMSGPGSDANRTAVFRTYLEEFIRDKGIRSVVDLGCGDWSYSRLVDWGGTNYTGIDVVESVIERNRTQYGSERVSFSCLNAATTDLPAADLLIAKEVLQHLPNADILAILSKLGAYKYAIFVNDITHHLRGGWKQLWQWKSICSTNADIEAGGYRLLRLTEPPFSLNATRVLIYDNRYKERRWCKEVLLFVNTTKK
ncbi:MAG: glycosyl transferase family protein [bacterium]|nr:MAG: glycosyl transferase family protein [bacterium]KAF0149821.1 MAG: glycosyl transferase family protein [bacterium]KAF0168522.1 MAG: glycosyl transferase family protein [bacterium]TXT19544.1 MAG: glycosyl transferase family protein [bacterium]